MKLFRPNQTGLYIVPGESQQYQTVDIGLHIFAWGAHGHILGAILQPHQSSSAGVMLNANLTSSSFGNSFSKNSVKRH